MFAKPNLKVGFQKSYKDYTGTFLWPTFNVNMCKKVAWNREINYPNFLKEIA